MNFPELQACYDEQVAALKSKRDESESIKQALSDAKAELETVDKLSRQAFAIKGELAQLEAAQSEITNQYRKLLEQRGPRLNGKVSSIKGKLVAKCNKELEAKYLPELESAMDQFIEVVNRYLDEEADFNEKIHDDIRTFGKFDNGKANINSVASGLPAYNAMLVVAEQATRIQKRK